MIKKDKLGKIVIQKKGTPSNVKEIDDLQKSKIETIQIHKKEEIYPTKDLSKALSNLLNSSFVTLNGADTTTSEKNDGLLGLVKELSNFAENPQVNRTTEKKISFGKSGVIDFRVSSRPIRTGPTTKPAVGLMNRKPMKQFSGTHSSLTPEMRTIKEKERIVDIFDEDDYLHVTVELPMVEGSEINLDIDDTTLTITAGPVTKPYSKTVKLPTSVEKEVIESRYRNGIFEAKLRKAKEKTLDRSPSNG